MRYRDGRPGNERYHMKTTVIAVIIAILSFTGCTTCRVTSVEDAERFAQNGYQTRVAVYKLGIDGLLTGGFLWTHHAQAQVLVENEWKWVEGSELFSSPTFTIADNEIHYWRATDYASFLKKMGKYN